LKANISLLLSGGDMSFIIQEERSSHSYRTEIPNILFDLDLDIYEFRVYLQLKKIAGDQSSCFQSIPTLAKACGMSEKKVREAKARLSQPFEKLNGLSLIRIQKRFKTDKEKDTDIITINNIWDFNFQIFFGGAPQEPPLVPDRNHPGSPRADKEDPYKKDKSTLKGVRKNKLKSEEYVHPKIQEIKIPYEDQVMLSQYPEHAIVSAIEDVKWYLDKKNKIKKPTSFMHNRIRHHAERRANENR
jgi:hypothetical protein